MLLQGLIAPAAAQEGTVTGLVIDQEDARALGTAQVQVLGGGSAAAGVLTDNAGRFRVQVPPGTYSLVAQLVGYRPARIDGVSVPAGGTTEIRISMTSDVFELNPVVVSVSRHEEKALESPSTIVTISKDRIEERAALSPIEHVKALPGVDVSQTGLTQSNVVTRGFNNIFSGSLLVMTDNRYAHVPSLRLNAYNMIPTTQFDVSRMEILLGPAAALYGPNSADGVLHIITTSPLDDPGTKVSVATGERSVFQAQMRTAHRLSETVGLKVSGQYFRGNDWEFIDPVEDSLSGLPGANPLIGDRDFESERYGGEARLDIRPWEDGEIIVNAGLNTVGSSIELTGIGAGQAKDWAYSYLQGRLRAGRLFSQIFMNRSDAGDTYILRTGQPIVDKSYLLVGQVQHGLAVGDRQDFIYGIDLQRTVPRTEGTITGRNEDDDLINEIGGYLHSETGLSEKVDLVAALRVDHHNRLEDLVFSPRAALVFKPTPEQNVRLTFNRAFSTPTTNNLFLDLLAARIPLNQQIGYDLRTRGVPETGFTFTDTCEGGLQSRCMYSPFAPGTQLPANAAVLWDGLVQALVPAALQPALLGPGSQTGDPALESTFRRFNQEALTFLPDEGPDPIERIKPTNTFELGYKGILGGKLSVAADVYTSRIRDFVGPLRVETPSVFYTPESVQAFVLKRLGPLIQAGLVSQQQAAGIISAFAMLPVGTVAPDQSSNSDLVLTYRNFGDVDLWGADLTFQYLATDRLSLTGSYSHVSDECFRFSEADPDAEECSSPLDIALNAPTNKGSIGARWEDKVLGLTLDGRARFSATFPMNSGVYTGTVDGYTVVDANVGYRFRSIAGASVSLTATNLFDNVHREFVGAPELGRLLLVRLQYEF
jgi:iron complex outermembrane receptor protein